MKTLMKTFFLMMIFGVMALLIGTLLLHSTWLSHSIEPSFTWTAGRCIAYVLLVLFKDQLAAFAVRRYHLETAVIKTVLPARWKLAVFFAVVELLIIQGGLAWLVSHCLGWL